MSETKFSILMIILTLIATILIVIIVNHQVCDKWEYVKYTGKSKFSGYVCTQSHFAWNRGQK